MYFSVEVWFKVKSKSAPNSLQMSIVLYIKPKSDHAPSDVNDESMVPWLLLFGCKDNQPKLLEG